MDTWVSGPRSLAARSRERGRWCFQLWEGCLPSITAHSGGSAVTPQREELASRKRGCGPAWRDCSGMDVS